MREFELTEHAGPKVQGIPVLTLIVAGREVPGFELQDVLFDTNSALVLFSKTGTGSYLFETPDVLASAKLYSHKHTNKKAMIFGHTDTTGQKDYNQKLSEWRANAIKGILTGDKDTFVTAVTQTDVVESLQKSLMSLHEVLGYSTNPGSIDNQMGPKTKKAIENFQSEYNLEFAEEIQAGSHEKLSVDGIAGKQTYGALFDIWQQQIALAIKIDGFEPTQVKFHVADKNQGIIGYGESKPLEGKGRDGLKSQTNRRVEIGFFLPDQLPEIEVPPKIKWKRPPARKPPPPKAGKVELWCRHTYQDKGEEKRRIAVEGEVLYVVPEKGKGDVVYGAAPEANITPTWSTPGDTYGAGAGALSVRTKKLEFKVPYYEDPEIPKRLRDLKLKDIGHLIKGELSQLGFAPQVYPMTVSAGNAGAHEMTVIAYPLIEHKQGIELGERFKFINKALENLKKVIKHSGTGAELEIQLLQDGYIELEGEFREDPRCSEAFYYLRLSGGYKRLVDANAKMPIPLPAISTIPKVIRDNVANIEIFFQLQGILGLDLSITRNRKKNILPKVELSGALRPIFGLDLSVTLFTTELIDAHARASSGVKVMANFRYDKENPSDDESSILMDTKVELLDVVGELTYELLNGRHKPGPSKITFYSMDNPLYQKNGIALFS